MRDPDLGEEEALQVVQGESGLFDRGGGVAAGVTAAQQQRVDRGVDDALHPPHSGGVGAPVLQEVQSAAGLEDAVQLRQGGPLLGDRAQHHGDDRGVHGRVGERERLGEPVPYLDGSEAELLTVMTAAADRDTGSDELAAAVHDWPTRYHLSRSRANLLRPLRIEPGMRVLDVGAGTGAIARHLGEQGAEVLALEGSLSRARVAAARCHDLGNVRVAVGQPHDVRERDFDLVCCIGVLEYSGADLALIDRLRLAFDAGFSRSHRTAWASDPVEHAVDPGHRSRREGAVVAATGPKVVRVEVVDVRSGQLGQVEVAEVRLEVALDDRARLLTVETDQPGLYGWGEATLEWKTRGVVGAVEDLSVLLIGQDPRRIHNLPRDPEFLRTYDDAVEGLDHRPPYPLSQPVSSDWSSKRIRDTVEAALTSGYSYVKCKIGRDETLDRRAAQLLLEGEFSRHFKVVFDANQAYRTDEAVELAEFFSRMPAERFQWFEQPVDRSDWKAMEAVCAGSPVAIRYLKATRTQVRPPP